MWNVSQSKSQSTQVQIMYSIAYMIYMIMLELVSEKTVIALSTMLFASVGKILAAAIEYW